MSDRVTTVGYVPNGGAYPVGLTVEMSGRKLKLNYYVPDRGYHFDCDSGDNCYDIERLAVRLAQPDMKIIPPLEVQLSQMRRLGRVESEKTYIEY